MGRNRIASIALASLVAGNLMAGGLFTQNNQNPIFFRQPAQHAVIGVQGAYYDPAGLVFMNDGWHFGLGDMMAIQTREVTSDYAPFAMNVNNAGSGTRKFKGHTFAPVIPSLDVVYTHNKWAASMHFGVMTGGGNCTFDDGLGSFEAPIALLPAAVNALAPVFSGYDADIHFTGKSFGVGGQFNFAYKIFDNGNSKLSLAGGIRVNYLRNSYVGGIFDYRLNTAMGMIPAENALKGVIGQFGLPDAQVNAIANALGADKEVDCVQTGWAFNPIVGVHYSVGAWDFSAKYEFITSMELKSNTDINTTGLSQFNDDAKVQADAPALVTAGFNVSILPQLRAGAGMNLYLDKSADYGNDREDKLGRNTFEFVAGVEYDLNSKWTVSLGTQVTTFDFGDNNDYLTDMSFSLPSWCLGGGFRYHFTDRLALDVAAFNTFYSKANKHYSDYGGAGATYQAALGAIPGVPAEVLSQLSVPGKDKFFRTSLTFGVGIVWDL